MNKNALTAFGSVWVVKFSYELGDQRVVECRQLSKIDLVHTNGVAFWKCVVL